MLLSTYLSINVCNKMQWIAMKTTFLYFFLLVNHVISHLKDLGEVSKNWTSVLKYLEKRIVGGKTASKKKFPHAVQIFNFGGLCGGTILTSKTVLTAAHCFDENENLAEIFIFANPRYLFDNRSAMHEVWDFKKHELYNKPAMFANDIAIVMIHDEFQFGPFIQKAKLSNTDMWMKESTVVVVTGWGETKYGEGMNNKDFKQTHLNYINKTTCMIQNEVILQPEMFCLYGEGIRDSCRGDSGGGVVWNGLIVGIVSHGRGCAEKPGIYMSVNYFRLWINETHKQLYENFCNFHNKLKIPS